MGGGRDKAGRLRRKNSLEISLLSTAFGLPSPFHIQRVLKKYDEQQAAKRAERETPPRIVVVRKSSKQNQEDDDYDDSTSYFSSFDEEEEDDDYEEEEEQPLKPARALYSPPPKSKRSTSRTTFRTVYLPRSKSKNGSSKHRRTKDQPARWSSPPPPPRITPPKRSLTRRSSEIRLQSRKSKRKSSLKPSRSSPRSSINSPSSSKSSHRSSKDSFESFKSSSRASTRRSAPTPVVPAPFASFVRPSASFPQQLPVPTCYQPNPVLAPMPAFSESTAQSARFPVHPHPFQQPPFAYTSMQTPTQAFHMPQYAAPPMAPPVAGYPTPMPHQVPAEVQPTIRNQEPPGWAASSGPYAGILQRIQRDIELVMAKLAHQPDHPVLRRELRGLQDQLNATLNSAIAKQELPKNEGRMASSIVPDFHVQEAAMREPAGKQVETNAGEGERGTSPPRPDAKSSHRKDAPVEDQEHDVGRISHHLCSGCGCVRSPHFHERYPFVPEQTRIINFCQACREKRIQRGVVGRYHFCFGCGQARSKEFLRAHPILPGDEILPNYCGPCSRDVKGDESIANASVVGSVSCIKRDDISAADR